MLKWSLRVQIISLYLWALWCVLRNVCRASAGCVKSVTRGVDQATNVIRSSDRKIIISRAKSTKNRPFLGL